GLKEGQLVGNITLQEYGGVAFWDAPALTGELAPATDPRASFRVWWKGLPNGKGGNGLPGEVGAIAASGPDKKQTPEAVAKLRAYYLAYVARPVNDDLAARQVAWEKAEADHHAAADAIPGTMVFGDLPTPRDSFVMLRGQYDKPGDKVQPGTP